MIIFYSALMFAMIFDIFLLLIPLGSTTAFTSIVGIATIGFQVSYGIPILFKLIFCFNDFPKTEMSLNHTISIIFNIISCIYLFGSSCLLFFPTSSPTTTDTMNWTIVVVAGFVFISVIYWVLYAKNNFRGPSRTKNDLSDPSTYEQASTVATIAVEIDPSGKEIVITGKETETDNKV